MKLFILMTLSYTLLLTAFELHAEECTTDVDCTESTGIELDGEIL